MKFIYNGYFVGINFPFIYLLYSKKAKRELYKRNLDCKRKAKFLTHQHFRRRIYNRGARGKTPLRQIKGAPDRPLERLYFLYYMRLFAAKIRIFIA